MTQNKSDSQLHNLLLCLCPVLILLLAHLCHNTSELIRLCECIQHCLQRCSFIQLLRPGCKPFRVSFPVQIHPVQDLHQLIIADVLVLELTGEQEPAGNLVRRLRAVGQGTDPLVQFLFGRCVAQDTPKRIVCFLYFDCSIP